VRRFDLTMFLYVYCPTGSWRFLSSFPRHRMPAWLRLSLNFCMRLSFIFKVSQHFLKSQLSHVYFLFGTLGTLLEFYRTQLCHFCHIIFLHCTFCTFPHQSANSANSAVHFFRTLCSKIER